MDAGLAKVLNSTVGTDEFKALDKVFSDNARLVGSDDVMYHYDGEFTYDTPSLYWKGIITSSYITFDKSGSVKIKTTQRGRRSDYPHTYDVYFINEAGATLVSVSQSIVYDGIAEISLSANVTAGAKYKVRINCYDAGDSPSPDIDVCGKIILFGANVTKTS